MYYTVLSERKKKKELNMDIKIQRSTEVQIIKQVKHTFNFLTGKHQQWVIERDGTEREIFEGDEEWEE